MLADLNNDGIKDAVEAVTAFYSYGTVSYNIGSMQLPYTVS